MEAPEILDLKGVSALTGLPVNTHRWYRSTGKGGPRTFRLGRRVVAYKTDVIAWLEEQHAKGSA